jgi:putative CocE/NonD family hydrolase
MTVSRRHLLDTSSAGALASSGPAKSWREPTAPRWMLPTAGPVEVIENEWIVLADGERLAAQLWLPRSASQRPAPVVLEYIPYRKRDQYRAYDQYWGQQLARFGIAYARVDVRGTGDSSGVLTDEYLPREQADALEVIAWLAEQPWSNGAVGMRGVSWGGFSTLQAAALAPPALKAIMPMCASDMRYTDDAHYVGGALGLTNLKWASSFTLVMAAPPDPQITGDDWEAAWMRRLEATPPIAATWLGHQRNDDYWMQGSVAADYAAIKCPVYLVGGLVDAYNDAIPRLLAKLKGPRKALIGPWRHGYPSPATPGPALDWVSEEVRWWDHWLNGVDTGLMNEPMLRVYMPEKTASETGGERLPGRWIAEPRWPSHDVRTKTLHLRQDELSATAGPAETLRLQGGRIVGLRKPEWVPFATSELPGEQWADDALSLSFDTPAQDGRLELLGIPVARLRISTDKPVATIAVRLSEVTDDGHSWLVSYGVLNLTHRDGHAAPAPLVPGQAYDVDVPLSFVAHRPRKGSRLRLAISDGLWPLVWPAPETASLDLHLRECRLDLPMRTPPPSEPPVLIPERSASAAEGGPVITADRSPNGEIRWSSRWPESRTEVRGVGTVITGLGPNAALSIREGEPNSGVWTVTQSSRYRRGDWDCGLESRVELRSTVDSFVVVETLIARRDGAVVFGRTRENTIARDLM